MQLGSWLYNQPLSNLSKTKTILFSVTLHSNMEKNPSTSDRCETALTLSFLEWFFMNMSIFLEVLEGRSTKILRLSHSWCCNEGPAIFRKKIYWLSFVNANKLIGDIFSIFYRLITNVEPTTLFVSLINDMILLLVMRLWLV